MQWWVARKARAHQSWPPIAPNNITIHSNKKNKKVVQCARAHCTTFAHFDHRAKCGSFISHTVCVCMRPHNFGGRWGPASLGRWRG